MADKKTLQATISSCKAVISLKNIELSAAEKELARMNLKPRVSDHAVIRYLERKYGFCFEDVRKEILDAQAAAAIEAGATKIKKGDMEFTVRDKCITTCF